MIKPLYRNEVVDAGPDVDATTARLAWERSRDELPAPDSTPNREEQLALERLLSAYEREHEALERWSARPPTTQPAVVVVHRHEWLRRRLAGALESSGWQVLDAEDQSAEAVAALITQQPRLLLMSDRVAGASGVELVSRTRRLGPSTRILVQVDRDSRASQFEEAGAHLVLSHRSAWQDLVTVADSLLP